MKASAIANSNIALVKYWGKRDAALLLPQNSSISMTCDDMFSHTTVEFSSDYTSDILILNGKEYTRGDEEYDEYIQVFMNLVRSRYSIKEFAKIISKNNFPTAAGLASSASGFAALAVAINEALGLNLDSKELSILSRQGSGSASRSVLGGFVEWQKGDLPDGTDSFALQIKDENHWMDFRMIACITTREAKKIKTRAGMSQTVDTSPMYKTWLETIEEDLKAVRAGIIDKDFDTVGKIAQANALKMHATCFSTIPPIVYWNGKTVDIIHKVLDLQDQGVKAYFTIDGGPQVKVLALEHDVDRILTELKTIEGLDEFKVCKPGESPIITDNHLF